jgi:serine/threonine protein phosphatase 1
MLTIVIGDIHGMAAKLENLLVQIDMWCAANARAEQRQLIFLGDYIDRGPDSRQVLQIVQRLEAEGAICLQGNHEELMLRATESEGDLTNFLANGGRATITSLCTPAAFRQAQEWVRALSTSHEDEARYYVHAGIRPRVPLDQQTPKPSFGFATASFVIGDRSRNTLSTVIRRRSILIRSKRFRTCATTAATSIRALE